MISSDASSTIEFDTYEMLIVDIVSVAAVKSQMKVYICGGWVRDKLMKRESSDIDIIMDKGNESLFFKTLDDNLKEVSDSLKKKGIVMEKKANDMMLNSGVIEGSNLKQYFIKFTDLESKSVISEVDLDFRMLNCKNLQEDLKTRDFTVNGLFYDVLEKKVVDHCYVRLINE